MEDAQFLSGLTTEYQQLQRELHHLQRLLFDVDSLPPTDPDQVKRKRKTERKYQITNKKATEASAKILAVLDHYQQWTAKPAVDNIKLMADRTIKGYKDNLDLAPILAGFKPITIDSLQETFRNSYFQTRKKLRSSGEREKILRLLTSTYPQSPREYLSVQKTLRDYQEPPISNLKALHSASKNANRNLKQGLPNEREIIIGLFKFLIERAQDEVVITFLERLLGRNGIQQFKELFPSTSASFRDLNFSLSDSFIQRLRQAFYEDIQLMGVNLPHLLSNPEYFQLLETDPIAYNFLQLYTMVAMGQQGVPITEIIPFTFRNLYDRYEDERKKINLKIAETYHRYSDYGKLIYSAQDAINHLVDISLTIDSIQQSYAQEFLALSGAEIGLDSSFGALTITSIDASAARQPVKQGLVELLLTDSLSAGDSLQIEIDIDKFIYTIPGLARDRFIAKVAARHKGLEIDPNGNSLLISGSVSGISRAALRQFAAKLSQTSQVMSIPLADRSYQGLLQILKPDEGYSLKLLPSLLQGRLDKQLVDSWSTLKSYDQFLRSPLSEQQMRGAGLALARRLQGPWYKDMRVTDMLRRWQQDVVNYRNLYIQRHEELFPHIKQQKELNHYLEAKRKLTQLIDDLQEHYRPAGTGTQQDTLAQDAFKNSYEAYSLQVLKRVLTDNLFGESLAATLSDTITKGQQEVNEVEQRVLEVEQKLSLAYPNKSSESPIVIYFQKQEVEDPLQTAWKKIEGLEGVLDQLQAELDALDETLVKEQLDAVRSISPLVQITEALSHLMYCLKDDNDTTGWLKRERLNEALLNQQTAPVFYGLLDQQLKQSRVPGRFAVSALTNLIKVSLEDLHYMRKAEFTQDSINISFFKKAAFVNMTINRLMTMPLFVNDTIPSQSRSILDAHRELAPIPILSDMALEFIYYTNIKDHRHAVSSFIRLLNQIMTVTEERAKAGHARRTQLAAEAEARGEKPQKIKPHKPSKALAFMNKYGYFMADLIDADSSAQVQSLLKGIADKKGSSRVKRREAFTANINGYVGVLAGSETLRNLPDVDKDKQQYATFAPTLPVGVSLSKLVGKGPKPESFSLFLSVLDLGSLTTYSLSDDISGDNQITFKNILKPGVQLHWNIQNSPFFLGVGAQTGPQFREFSGEQRQLQATTLFFNMGIDVVIKRLY